jgi:arylformamidase
MKIYDISQELLSCKVFPGDPEPKKNTLLKIKDGDVCNLSAIEMCAHNGTHIDAPYHFIDNGLQIDQVPLDKLVGYAMVVEHSGDITGADAEAFLDKTKNYNKNVNKILIKGNATVTYDAAKVFGNAKIDLIGNESQTVGPEDAPREVHLTLLGAGVILLEGIRLLHVPEGVYLLNAVPINISGGDGSPCRAILMDLE